MNIKEITIEYLKANGFDGLCNGDIECGCRLVDLMPCSGPNERNCEPAYEFTAPKGSEYDFIMSTNKDWKSEVEDELD